MEELPRCSGLHFYSTFPLPRHLSHFFPLNKRSSTYPTDPPSQMRYCFDSLILSGSPLVLSKARMTGTLLTFPAHVVATYLLIYLCV